MTDPVTAADGHSYEHSEIKRWLQNSDLSPQTGALLPNKQLTRSHALRNAIEEFQAGQKKRAQQIQKLQQRVPASHSGVKVILLGDSNVGKTSLLHRVKEGSFSEAAAQPTIGCSFCTHSVAIGGQQIGLAIWDTAGQEKYRSFTRQYFRGASAAALVYDTTTADSLAGAQRLLKEVKSELDDVVVVLVGSKCDLTDKRAVDFARAAEVAAAEGAEHIECSAKDGTNVEAVRARPCHVTWRYMALHGVTWRYTALLPCWPRPRRLLPAFIPSFLTCQTAHRPILPHAPPCQVFETIAQLLHTRGLANP